MLCIRLRCVSCATRSMVATGARLYVLASRGHDLALDGDVRTDAVGAPAGGEELADRVGGAVAGELWELASGHSISCLEGKKRTSHWPLVLQVCHPGQPVAGLVVHE